MELMLSPLSWLLLVVLVACGSSWWGRYRRIALAACAVSGLAAVAAMTPLFANLLLGHLENASPAPASCEVSTPTTAVVLAGGVSGRASGPDDLAVLGLATRRRLDRAVAWWREGRGRHLVMSGGSWFDGGVADARLMLRYAQALGVPPSAMSVEGASLTTWESAQRLATMRPGLPARVALVTSAVHMPRAVYAMSEAGFNVCPVAADRRQVPLDLPGFLIPQRSALEKTENALHEVVGLAWYHWLAFRDRG